MSAYMVEDSTINKILEYIRLKSKDWEVRVLLDELMISTSKSDMELLGNKMFELNAMGVNARYGKGEAEGFRTLDYKYKLELPHNTLGTYKLLGCLLYQCSEGNVPDMKLFKALDAFHNRLAHSIVSSLPEYARYPWG